MTTQISGTTGVSQVQPASVVDASLNLTANSAPIKTALNASGSAPIYAARAWVNFNGQGTVAIRASGNVTSLVDNGTGDYTINFTTPIPSANYATLITGQNIANAWSGSLNGSVAPSASAVRIIFQGTAAIGDQPYANVAIFN